MPILTSLKNQKHFDLVNKQGKKIYNKFFLLVLALNHTEKNSSDSSTIHFGMKVSKKVGSAVVRNKIKRRLRHLVREISQQISSRSLVVQLSLIIIPKRNFEKLKFIDLYRDFENMILPQISK